DRALRRCVERMRKEDTGFGRLVKAARETSSLGKQQAVWLQKLETRLQKCSRPLLTAGFSAVTLRAGLPNLGQSCYMNAVVQCWYACRALRADVLKAEDVESNGRLHARGALRGLMNRLHSRDWDCVCPFELQFVLRRLDPARWADEKLADVVEFAAFLLECCLTDKSLVQDEGSSDHVHLGRIPQAALPQRASGWTLSQAVSSIFPTVQRSPRVLLLHLQWHAETFLDWSAGFKCKVGVGDVGYVLKAMVVHGREHYVAFVRRNDRDWLRCDDSVVEPVVVDALPQRKQGTLRVWVDLHPECSGSCSVASVIEEAGSKIAEAGSKIAEAGSQMDNAGSKVKEAGRKLADGREAGSESEMNNLMVGSLASESGATNDDGFRSRSEWLQHVQSHHGGLQKYRNAFLHLESLAPHVVVGSEVRHYVASYSRFLRHAAMDWDEPPESELPRRCMLGCAFCARSHWREAMQAVYLTGEKVFMNNAEAVWDLLSVKRYQERWPLIPLEELEASAVDMSVEGTSRFVLLHKRRITPAMQRGEAPVLACADCVEAFSAKKPWLCKYALANDLWLGRPEPQLWGANLTHELCLALARTVAQ
ncbi:tkt, partial [Symbiodinium sp. CCMP2592]